MPKKRILIFIDWFLPGDKAGGPIRSCANLIDHLQDEFEFSVVTRDTDYTETKPYPGIKPDSWNILPDGKRVYYISAANLNRPQIERLLREEQYDAVYLNGIWSQPFTAWPLRILKKNKSSARVVVAVRGMLAPSAMAIKATKKKAFLAYAKLWRIFSGVIFHATSETEAAETRNVFGRNTAVLIAGNLPRAGRGSSVSRREKHQPLSLVSVARIAPEKNTLYAIEALAKVKTPVQMDFFGTVYDTEYFAACKSAAAQLPPHVKASFHGPADSAAIPDLLREYDLLFLPTRGENFGHIILESMQAGTPVLISDQTPWKNLAEAHAGWELPLNDANLFAEQIDSLAAMAPAEYQKWTEGALHFAARYAADKNLVEASRKLFGGSL